MQRYCYVVAPGSRADLGSQGRVPYVYIYIYEPDTFWVNAPGNFIIYHKYTGKLLLYTPYIDTW